MRKRRVYSVLKMSVLTIAGLSMLASPASPADGTAVAVTGISHIKEQGQDWRELKRGYQLKEGVVVRIEASSSVVIKAAADLVEFSAGQEGSEVVIFRFFPLEFAVRGIGVRHRALPSPPDPVFPAEGFRSVDGSVELSWSALSGGLSYRVQVSSTPDFAKPLLDVKSYDAVEKVEGLERGRYYWRVSATSADGIEGEFSEARSFGVKPLPSPPSLNPPASTKTSTTFRWKRRSEGERYHLQISRDKGFSETTVDLKGIEDPRVTVGMLDEGDYFVRVSSIDDDGLEGGFSEPQPFYVGPRVPSSNIGPLMIMFGVAFMLLGL